MMSEVVKEFGGYLPLELPPATGEWFGGAGVFRLNSGKAAFYAAAKQKKPRKVWLPYFHSPESHRPFEQLGIEVERYFLNENLLPTGVDPRKDELLVWTNYYGNATLAEIDSVVEQFGDRLLLDNCHAFFAEPMPSALNVYSCRKFFGVGDGAYLVGKITDEPAGLEKDFSSESSSHLLIQWESGTNAGYSRAVENELRLSNNYGLMSQLTQTLLNRIDYHRIRKTRAENLKHLHGLLGGLNSFDINLIAETQILYPFLSSNPTLRQLLAERGVYCPHWWSHVLGMVPASTIEYRLSSCMVLLPIDQRYGASEIDTLAQTVLELV